MWGILQLYVQAVCRHNPPIRILPAILLAEMYNLFS